MSRKVRTLINQSNFTTCNGQLLNIDPLLSQGYMAVGVDLAKSVYQVCYVALDPADDNVYRINESLTYDEFKEFILDMERQGQLCLFGMEGCSNCSMWANFVMLHGHACKVLPTYAVHQSFKESKDDYNDARAIFELVQKADVKTCYVKSLDEIEIQNTLNSHEHYIQELDQWIKRAMFYVEEHGYKWKGKCCFKDAIVNLTEITTSLSTAQSIRFKKQLEQYSTTIQFLNEQIELTNNDIIKPYIEQSIQCKLLMTIPNVGPYFAFALMAMICNVNRFENARQMQAYFGFRPGHTGSGGSIVLGWMARNGNPAIRRILYEVALSAYRTYRSKRYKKDGEDLPKLINKLLNSDKHFKRKVIKLASKILRTCFGVLHSGIAYDPNLTCNNLGKGKTRIHSEFNNRSKSVATICDQIKSSLKTDESYISRDLERYQTEQQSCLHLYKLSANSDEALLDA